MPAVPPARPFTVPDSPPADPPASLRDPREFLATFAASARRQGFREEHYGEVGGLPLLAVTRRTPGPRPRIYLSAGIHGDEPAPPLALLQLLERGHLDTRAVWFLCPLVNPRGFPAGTRENPEGLDLNRDYLRPHSAEIQAHTRWLARQPAFDLAICLHEDWEARGFYVYELNRSGAASLAPTMLAAATPTCPIETAPVIDGRPVAEPGIIRPVADPALRDRWPESIYLQANFCRLGYTIETPSTFPLSARIATLAAAVEAALAVVTGAPATAAAGWQTGRSG